MEFPGVHRDRVEIRRLMLLAASAIGILVLAAAVGLIVPALGVRLPVLLLAGVIGLGMILILLRKPDLALVFLLLGAFIVPLEIGASESVSVNVVVFLVIAIAILWAARGLRRQEREVVLSRTMIPMIVFLGVALISWLYGNANWEPRFPRPTRLILIQTAQYAVYILSFVVYFIAAQQSTKVLRWITSGFIALGILALIGRYGGIIGRPFTFLLTDAWGSGIYYIWLTALTGSQALFNKQIKQTHRKILLGVAVLVPLLGFFYNTSWTSSWLPPLFVLLFLMWLRSRFSAGVLALMLSIFVVSGLIFQFFNWELERELSVGGRFTLWEAVWNLAKEEPILGLGLTTYRQYHRFIPLLTDHGAWYEPNVNSHNLYLDIFAQMGVIGLAVFLWLVAEIGLKNWKLMKKFSDDFNAAYVAGALAGLLGTLFASGIVEWMLPFVYNVGLNGFRFSVFAWIFLGGLIALERLPTQDELSA